MSGVSTNQSKGDETGPSEVEPQPEEIEEVNVTESAEYQELVEESSPPTEHVSAEADPESETEETGESKVDDSPNTTEEDNVEGGETKLDDIPDTGEDGTEDAAQASADKEEESIEEGASEEAHEPAHATTTEASESEDVATTDVPPADSEPKE